MEVHPSQIQKVLSEGVQLLTLFCVFCVFLVDEEKENPNITKRGSPSACLFVSFDYQNAGLTWTLPTLVSDAL